MASKAWPEKVWRYAQRFQITELVVVSDASSSIREVGFRHGQGIALLSLGSGLTFRDSGLSLSEGFWIDSVDSGVKKFVVLLGLWFCRRE